MFDDILYNFINKLFVCDSCTYGIIMGKHILMIFFQTTLFLQNVLELYLLMLADVPKTYSIFTPGDTDNPGVSLFWFIICLFKGLPFYLYASQQIHLPKGATFWTWSNAKHSGIPPRTADRRRFQSPSWNDLVKS